MITSCKYFIISTSDGVSRPNFSIGERATKCNKTTDNPADKKDIWGDGCTCRIRSSSEYTHANHQSDNDHGDVEQVEERFF